MATSLDLFLLLLLLCFIETRRDATESETTLLVIIYNLGWFGFSCRGKLDLKIHSDYLYCVGLVSCGQIIEVG